MHDVADSLREAFFMFWATLWPLILGFTLSGAVQAFVSHQQMQRAMGDHRPGSVARASFFGMVSSSCSYAATAMAKSLFQKGADFVTAMIFMFASTNLVLELGIVLLVLMGWQFAVSEYIGGLVMIILLAVTGGFVLKRGPTRESEGDEHDHHHHDGATTKAGWADAASYAMADLTMLRRELVIGYLVAGFLTVLVPTTVWNDVFLRGHGFWTSLENVVVGPFIAIVSFVCSVGNVPMAAALWKGGISFGGVISFIFADLITLPLLLIYRKYYGTRTTLKLLAWFWAVMSVAGLAVEGVFSGFGLLPTKRPHDIVHTSFEWNYTTFLNIAFLILFAYLYWLYRTHQRDGGSDMFAIDPICGMQVRKADAPARCQHEGNLVYFCSDHCRERFEASAGVNRPAAP
jgi:uncharacterized protein